jgi:hypothetical protein
MSKPTYTPGQKVRIIADGYEGLTGTYKGYVAESPWPHRVDVYDPDVKTYRFLSREIEACVPEKEGSDV